MDTNELLQISQEYESIDEIIELVPSLQKMPVVEVGEFLSQIEDHDLITVLDHFSPAQQGVIVADFPVTKQLSLFHSTSKKRFAVIFENMPSDIRADLYQEFTSQEQTALLPFLSKKVRENVLVLSSYEPETAGGIMSTDFATVQKSMTCEEAMAKVRSDAPSKRTIYYIYVVDHDQKMQGFITMKDLILADPKNNLEKILRTDFAFVYVDEDREAVAKQIEKYDLVAIPVLNSSDQLVGIVTHDEAIEIIRAEHTEDLEKFMGITGDTEEFNYDEISVAMHFRKRFTWLVVLLAFGLFSGMVIQHFSYAIERIIILALFMPMIAATGGNVGSQAASVIIRAMALGQISVVDWWKVIWKESRASLLLGLSLGAVGFINVIIIANMSDVPQPYPLWTIGLVIALALSAQVISSSMIGAILPLIVKKLKGDPAVVASPAITSLVDVTGLLLYFGITTAFFFL